MPSKRILHNFLFVSNHHELLLTPEFKVVIFLNKSVTIYNFADTLSQTGNILNQLHVDKLANFSFKSKLAVGLRQYD